MEHFSHHADHPEHSPKRRALFGFLLVGLGVLFLLDNFEIIEFNLIHQYWPVIIMYFGVAKFIAPRYPDERASGIWLVFVGLWCQVSVLHLYGLSFHNSWPILLIGLGVKMLWKSMNRRPSIV